MIKLYWRAVSLMLIAFLTIGCSQNSDIIEAGQGVVRISKVDIDSEITSTRLSAEDLSLRLENTRAEVLRTWEKLVDVPEQIRMVTGSYKLVAWMGDTSTLPSFTEGYYVGESKFAVTAGQEVAVAVAVKHGVSKVAVQFDKASFDAHYSAYSADLRTTTQQSPDTRFLTFTALNTEDGNFMPGNLRIRLCVTSKADGKEYVFYPSPINGLKAAQRQVVTLKVVRTSGDNNLLVTTDTGYEKEEEIVLELPGSSLPKAAPVIRANNFTVGQVVEGNEGYIPTTKYAATIAAPAGIKSVKIRTTSPVVSQMWGGQSELEVVGASKEVHNLLTTTGFVWDEALNSAQTAAVKYGRTEISFARLFGSLSATASGVTSTASSHSFEIEVVDMLTQSNIIVSSGEGRFYFTAKVNPPVFGWGTPNRANVWSTHAEFDVHYLSNTPKVPKIWIKEGDGVWSCPATEQFKLNYGETDNGVITITELKPATTYTFKLMMGDHSTAELIQTTEILQSVFNGDMETWQAEQLSTGPHKAAYYQPYAKGGSAYWTTNNDRTTSYRTGAFTYGYNCFPAVSYTFAARSGNYAAEIRTVSASNINPLNTTSISQGKSQTTGRLYIGDYAFSNGSDNISYGKPFVSRPQSLRFYYNYAPYGSDSFSAAVVVYGGGSQIGRGEFKSGAAVRDYTQATIDIVYSDRRVCADKMSVVFQSSASGNAVRKLTIDLDMTGNIDYNKGWNAWVGSILRVDDIEVLY